MNEMYRAWCEVYAVSPTPVWVSVVGWGILALVIFCMALACYLYFFPLAGAIMGGMLRAWGFKKYVEIGLRQPLDSFKSDMELGPTMADGGERTTGGKAGLRRKRSRR
jgi:hypothetical protein